MGESLLSAFPNSSDIPSGIICMWSGASTNIPTGWALCNGQNGTPNLVDRFIVGAGSSYAVGATGGEATHKLTTAEMPSHTHSASISGSTDSAGAHTHTVTMSAGMSDGSTYLRSSNASNLTKTGTAASAGAHTHTLSGSVSVAASGGNSAHENRPPYYALCFIMKL